MATKKKTTEETSKSAFGSKSAFVRSLDPKIPAAEVVKQAKEKGISLTVGLVYNIRSASNLTGQKRGPKPGKSKTVAASGMTASEAQLRNAIADLGLVKATEILESVKATIRRG